MALGSECAMSVTSSPILGTGLVKDFDIESLSKREAKKKPSASDGAPAHGVSAGSVAPKPSPAASSSDPAPVGQAVAVAVDLSGEPEFEGTQTGEPEPEVTQTYKNRISLLC